jgi:hypothetical protein
MVYVVPPWETDPSYESEWDKLVQLAPPLPEPVKPSFTSLFNQELDIKVVDSNGLAIQKRYIVQHTSRIDVADFLEKYHYLGRPPHHAKYYFKLVDDGNIVGAAAFASLRAPAVKDGIFSSQVSASDGLEVARFACIDECHKNTESFFMSKCIQGLGAVSPNVKFLITYSQKEQGHFGYVYQATNWTYLGDMAGGKVRYYLDGIPITRKTLKHRHGVDTGRAEWRDLYGPRIEYRRLPPKYKYIYIINKTLKESLSIPYLPYPKADD